MSHAKSTAAQMESTRKTEMKIQFKNGDIKMAGSLFLPEGFVEGKKYAAIVCVHPSGGVKERSIIEHRRRLVR